jgi:hypothetical protein
VPPKNIQELERSDAGARRVCADEGLPGGIRSLPGRPSSTRLLQIREARTEVDVKDLFVQDQCGD